jgi:4-hydroxybenzoate polyprenyltransferase
MLRQPGKADFCSSYLLSLRPQQWTKNLIVFAAPLFAFDLNLSALLGSSIAFLCFCSLSSSFYLINDIADVESDRLHPVKCKRPIASGLVPMPIAWLMALSLMVIALIAGGGRSHYLLVVLIAYGILQVAYNLKLKRVPILDIIVIAMGFVLRALAGFAATEIVLSYWFILCTAMLALFLAVEKRKAEIVLSLTKGTKPRAVLSYYSLSLLNRMESVVTTGAIMSYAIWSSGPQVKGATTPYMMLTIPFVIYGVFRYQLLSEGEEIYGDKVVRKTERPEEVLLKDKPLLLNIILWLFSIFIILYFKSIGVIH